MRTKIVEKADAPSQKPQNVYRFLLLVVGEALLFLFLFLAGYLMDSHLVDFEDMINESARILREMHAKGERLDFRYIIVDEYQDISRQRFDLTTALAEVCDAKIIAVGDDWQSIYAFSGSDVELFTKFQEKMGYGKLLKIVKT